MPEAMHASAPDTAAPNRDLFGFAPDTRTCSTLLDDATAAGLALRRGKAREWVVDAGGITVRVRTGRSPRALVAGIGGPDIRLTVAGAYARLGLSPAQALSGRETYLMGCAMGLLYEPEPYRNHFTVHPGHEDHATWSGLCARGLAVGYPMPRSALRCFRVTDAGAAAYGVRLKDEDRVVPEAA